MTTKHKNNIFEVLGHLNNKDAEYYSKLPEDQQKAIVPLLLQRWMTGTSDARQIFLINEVVNPFVFSLFRHRQLLWQLLSVVGPGKFAKYTWMSQKSEAGQNKPVSTQVVADYYKYSLKHARDAVKLLTYEQVVDLAQELGHQPDVLAKIKKEYGVSGGKSG